MTIFYSLFSILLCNNTTIFIVFMQCMQAFQLQPTLHIIPDKEIIPRHLAANDVKSLIVGTADHVPFELVVLWQIKVMNLHADIYVFVCCEIPVMCQECKAVCT